jgi:hypothetical protein
MPGASYELDAGLKETGTMINLTLSAEARNRNVGVEADFAILDIEKPRDRAWWAAEAARSGTDWRSLGDAVLEVLVSVGLVQLEQSTVELTCDQADRERMPGPSQSGAARAAPRTTIEALMLSLRRGINELTQPSTLRRLSTLDEDQLEDVCLRVQVFLPRIASAWSADDADLLISAWRKFREQR